MPILRRKDFCVMFPEVEYLGPSLPPGWQRPSRGMVEAYLSWLDEGLARIASPHLYVEANPITEAVLRDREVHEGIEMLRAYADPNSPSPLTAVGMAYPQLDRARLASFRVLVANIGMPDLRTESRQAQVEIFMNPILTPYVDDGYEDRLEACFSAPGMVMMVRRWKTVFVQAWGRPVFRASGTDARILQHENDHLNGVICAQRAMQQNNPFYFVPTELARMFYREVDNYDDWPLFPVEQWLAMTRGDFALEDYAHYVT